MRKIFTLALAFTLYFSASATIRIVTCQNGVNHFLPVTINAVCYDTIRWTWVSGGHIVGPITAADIPVGAAMFNGPIDVNNQVFEYVVTVAGNYHYVCHPSTPHGEDGFIVVTCASGIQPHITPTVLSYAYPNPFYDKITIETSTADQITIFDVIGDKVLTFTLTNGQTKLEADLRSLPKGMFFYSIISEGIIIETKKIVKQ